MHYIELLIFALGAISAAGCILIAKLIVAKLNKTTEIVWSLTDRQLPLMIVSGIIFGTYSLFLYFSNLELSSAIVLYFLFCILLIITLVDICIRIIPNFLVAILLIAAPILYSTNLLNETAGKLLIGFAIALIVFAIPFYLTDSMGGGDVRLAAVTGLWVGFPDIAFAFTVMGIALLAYALYLKISKKGGFKSQIALGPFIALGMIVTMTLKRL